MAGTIHGVLDGIAADAQGLQGVSDTQAGLMHQLGSTLEGLGSTLHGQGGIAMQQVGAELIHQGQQLSNHFADHSGMMSNNGQLLDSGDTAGAHAISQVTSLI